jgi:hypothetical protein
MAISINWATRVIFVPKSDMTLIQSSPIEIRELNLNTFRLALKDLEDSEEGIMFPYTHVHNPPVVVGGVTLARVVELVNGYTVTFEDGNYAVNLVGANSNVADKVNLNSVSVRASNSAGLIQTREIEHSSFLGGVTIDVVNGVAGTTYPVGTPTRPVNNLSDALLIAAIRGFNKFFCESDLTINSGDFTGKIFIGNQKGGSRVNLVVQSGAIVEGCSFRDVNLSGVLDNNVEITGCIVGDITFRGSLIEKSFLSGNISLTGNNTVHVLGCVDYSPLGTIPMFDFSTFSGDFSVLNYIGGILLKNKSSANSVILDLQTGKVVLDTTVSAGTIVIRGIGTVENNSTGTAVVDTESLLSQTSVTDSVWDEVLATHGITGSAAKSLLEIFRIYGLDPTRPLVVTTNKRTVGSEIEQDIFGDPNVQITVVRK